MRSLTCGTDAFGVYSRYIAACLGTGSQNDNSSFLRLVLLRLIQFIRVGMTDEQIIFISKCMSVVFSLIQLVSILEDMYHTLVSELLFILLIKQ
jgi:hypothetical protein